MLEPVPMRAMRQGDNRDGQPLQSQARASPPEDGWVTGIGFRENLWLGSSTSVEVRALA